MLLGLIGVLIELMVLGIGRGIRLGSWDRCRDRSRDGSRCRSRDRAGDRARDSYENT